jgi:hypothetical protein
MVEVQGRSFAAPNSTRAEASAPLQASKHAQRMQIKFSYILRLFLLCPRVMSRS